MGADGPLHPQVVPITFLVGTPQASPVGWLHPPCSDKDHVLVLGQVIKVKEMCIDERGENREEKVWGLLPSARAGCWGQPSTWSETCQLVPWKGVGDRDSQEELGYVTLWLPQILFLLVSPVSQRAAM